MSRFDFTMRDIVVLLLLQRSDLGIGLNDTVLGHLFFQSRQSLLE